MPLPPGTHAQSMVSDAHQRWRFENGVPVRNKRDVWTVPVESTVKEAHFAVFPRRLIEPCVLAGCPEGGVVLDPFSGSGTTGVVAVTNNRSYIGVELNPQYVDISKRRIQEAMDDITNPTEQESRQ